MDSWFTACAAAQLGAPKMIAAPTAKRTVRTELLSQRSGPQFRLALGAKYDRKPLYYGKIVAQTGGVQAALTFGGDGRVTVPPGGTVYSDPVPLAVRAGENVTVWLYNDGAASSVSLSPVRQQHSEPGDFCGRDFSTQPFKPPLLGDALGELLGGVLGLQVSVPADTAADGVVAFGDSITASDIWVKPLRAQLAPRPLFNLGISGNRLLLNTSVPLFSRSQIFGRAGLTRMRWDLLELTGIKTVLLALGTNDISQPGGTPGLSPPKKQICTLDALLDGYRTFLDAARQNGLQVVGATITPFGGYKTYAPEKEAIRRQANDWILGAGAFDATVDFAAAICDSAAPERLAAEFDSGDHLHPNEAAGAVMAQAAAACDLLR